MKLYADRPARLLGQIVADLLGLAGVILAVLLGVTVHGLIAGFATVGTSLRDAGSGFQQTMSEIGGNLAQVPLIGGGISTPFDSAAVAGGTLEQAGADVEAFVETLAIVSGALVTLGPLMLLAAIWVLPRLWGARRAARVRDLARTADGAEILALRALTRRPPSELARVSSSPLAAWRAGEADTIAGLAELELARAGVRGPRG